MLVITPIAKQFALHTRLFNNVLQGIADADAGIRISDNINHLQWIAGHLNASRYGIAGLLGLEASFKYMSIYADATQPPPGNRALDATITYPTLTDIMQCWNDFAPAFNHAVSNLPNQQLDEALPPGLPFKTLIDLLSFVASHESYHIGQMSIIRRYLGLGPMQYN